MRWHRVLLAVIPPAVTIRVVMELAAPEMVARVPADPEAVATALVVTPDLAEPTAVVPQVVEMPAEVVVALMVVPRPVATAMVQMAARPMPVTV